MFRRIKSLILRNLLNLALIALVVGAVRYFQGPTSIQFLGIDNIYAVQPWVLALCIMLLWLAWMWVKAVLRGFFLQLPSAISMRLRHGIHRLYSGHLRQGIAQLVRGHPDKASRSLAKYVRETAGDSDSFQLWALGVHVFLTAGETANARALFDVHKKPRLPEPSNEITHALLNVRLLLAEGKSQAAITSLLGTISRHPDSQTPARELLRLLDGDDLGKAALLLLSEIDDSDMPKLVHSSLPWRRLRAVQKLHEDPASDEWLSSLESNIRLHPTFALAHLRQLSEESRIDDCYRAGLDSLRHQWSEKLAAFLRQLPEPGDSSLPEQLDALSAEHRRQ